MFCSDARALRTPIGRDFGCERSEGIFRSKRSSSGYVLQIEDHAIGYPLSRGRHSIGPGSREKITIRRVHVHLNHGWTNRGPGELSYARTSAIAYLDRIRIRPNRSVL